MVRILIALATIAAMMIRVNSYLEFSLMRIPSESNFKRINRTVAECSEKPTARYQ